MKKCPKSHEPNRKTIKAMKEAEKGINLKRFDSIEELFKALNK
jgi:antitoxin component of RelBE/YafQ-DinJ toxin-antitoxin module